MRSQKKVKIETIRRIKWQMDVLYNSIWLKKLVNKLMFQGKKTVVEKIIYNTIVGLKIKFKKNPIILFDKILLLSRPLFLFRVKRIFSKNHQIPVPITFRRQIIVSLGWLSDSIKNRKELTLENKIFNEFSSFLENKENSLVSKRNKFYESATVNRINTRYRWV